MIVDFIIGFVGAYLIIGFLYSVRFNFHHYHKHYKYLELREKILGFLMVWVLWFFFLID